MEVIRELVIENLTDFQAMPAKAIMARTGLTAPQVRFFRRRIIDGNSCFPGPPNPEERDPFPEVVEKRNDPEAHVATAPDTLPEPADAQRIGNVDEKGRVTRTVEDEGEVFDPRLDRELLHDTGEPEALKGAAGMELDAAEAIAEAFDEERPMSNDDLEKVFIRHARSVDETIALRAATALSRFRQGQDTVHKPGPKKPMSFDQYVERLSRLMECSKFEVAEVAARKMGWKLLQDGNQATGT